MPRKSVALNRREFVSRAVLSSFTSALAIPRGFAEDVPAKEYRICAFEKFLQSLSFSELADVIAELGFVGIEATVRSKGHVLPERVRDDLPRAVEAARAAGLEVTMITTAITGVDDPHARAVLQRHIDRLSH